MVAFDEDFAIGVELDAARAVLVLSEDLGIPVPGQELDAYKLLLQVATAWRETRGLYMGLDPLDDAVVQMRELPLAGLEREAASQCFMSFVNAARSGRQILASMKRDEAALTGPLDFIRA